MSGGRGKAGNAADHHSGEFDGFFSLGERGAFDAHQFADLVIDVKSFIRSHDGGAVFFRAAFAGDDDRVSRRSIGKPYFSQKLKVSANSGSILTMSYLAPMPSRNVVTRSSISRLCSLNIHLFESSRSGTRTYLAYYLES